MNKHGPNTARKFNHDGYSCKNTVLIVTTMGKTEKTRSKWATMGGMSNMVLIVTARLQLSSVEYRQWTHVFKILREIDLLYEYKRRGIGQYPIFSRMPYFSSKKHMTVALKVDV